MGASESTQLRNRKCKAKLARAGLGLVGSVAMRHGDLTGWEIGEPFKA